METYVVCTKKNIFFFVIYTKLLVYERIEIAIQTINASTNVHDDCFFFCFCLNMNSGQIENNKFP